MLLSLNISNLALIDRTAIEFSPGMNVLTGETGAGKSIVVDAVNLVLGERADRELIADGQSRARVEAVFDITDNVAVLTLLGEMQLTGDGDSVCISRELTAAGKNLCRVNGVIVPLVTLRRISAQLLDIHGQHEHQLLLDSERHMDYLDAYAAEQISPALDEVDRLYTLWREAAKKLSRLRKSVSQREQRTDMLRYQLEELRGANLRLGEEEELERKKTFNRNAEKIISAFDDAYAALAGGERGGRAAVELLRASVTALSAVSGMDERYEAVASRLSSLFYELEDVAGELGTLREGMDYDEREVERVEERLDLLHRLGRKYGHTTQAMIAYRDRIAEELSELEGADESIEHAEKEYRRLSKALEAANASLTGARKEAAIQFEKSIEAQLHELGMKNAKLSMAFAPLAPNEKPVSRFSAKGVDRVEMMFCANLGQPMRPLAKVASGGELSRIMLALKNLASQKPGIPRSMVFDEIDTGISGRTAQVVAEKMSQIGDRHQVICVTHLPQIAAMADEQFLVKKGDTDGVTRTEVTRLNEQERVKELSRMIGGVSSESESALAHARAMLRDAQERKRILREQYRANA